MSEIELFDVAGEKCRFGVAEDGRAYVVASDYAKRLGYRDASDALRNVEDGEKGTQIVRTPGGGQRMSVLYEEGIWELVFLSRRPEAKAIKARVKEILRTIRKTGRYEVAPQPAIPQTFADALQLAADQARQLEAQREQLAIVGPKAEAHDVFESADGTFSFEQVAKMLHVETNLGRNNLIKRLREVGVLTDRNLPYQRYAHHFHVVASSFEHTDGRREITYTTRVRATGVDFIRRKLGAAQGVLVPVT